MTFVAAMLRKPAWKQLLPRVRLEGTLPLPSPPAPASALSTGKLNHTYFGIVAVLQEMKAGGRRWLTATGVSRMEKRLRRGDGRGGGGGNQDSE